MSHVTTVKTKITDLAALRAAAEELGGVWCEGQRTYNWYGRHVGDFPMPEGMTEADLGKCAHAIRVPGVEYEVGVYQKQDGTYGLAFDFYGSGKGLQARFGKTLEKLTQGYSLNKATNEFQSRGYAVQRVQGEKGHVKLQVTRGW